MKTAGNNYIGALVEISNRDRSVGLRVNDNETLDITPFANGPQYEGQLVIHSNAGGEGKNVLTTVDSAGNETSSEISDAHATELQRTLVPVTHPVHDRSSMDTVYERGVCEANELESLNEQFGVVCRNADWHKTPFTPFDSLHPSWCK